MSIVCRQQEISCLEKLLSSKKPEFLAVYGRRRVGKTYLIRCFFTEKEAVLFSVMGSKTGSYRDQIAHFTRRIGEVFLGGIVPQLPDSWDSCFILLTQAINKVARNKKIVIFMDELPWLATRRSGLLETLDYYWNQYWSMDKRIKLIVCGSSASWIINKIINNRGGLHNRVTETIHLKPFKLGEVEQYLLSNKINLTRKQIVELYLVTGGVPFYLDHVKRGFSANQIIESLAFNDRGLLLNEFDKLFSSLFDHSETYIEMIEVIAGNWSGIGQEELFRRLKLSSKGNTGLSRLRNLEDAGFVMSFTPHFHQRKGIYYRLVDEYSIFYCSWIAPLKRSKMSQAFESGYWRSISQTPRWFSWAGYAFEALCYQHLNQIRRSLSLSPTAVPNSWRYMPRRDSDQCGAQIDLLFDRDDGAISVCEIKYSRQSFVISKDYAEKLKQKLKVFRQVTRTDKQLLLVMIVANGLKHNKYSEDLVDAVVTLEDLF